jgi:hypothetical protein
VESIDSRDVKPESASPLSSDAANVAVIAIHGVGQHLSGASADAVSTLLLSIGRSGRGKQTSEIPQPAPLYSGFVATSIDVPLRPVQSPPAEAAIANDRHQPSPLSRIWGIFNERRGYLAATREKADYVPGYAKRELREGEPDRGDYAYEFMLTQVAGYQGDVDRNFQTVRFEGKRAPRSPAANVHIYDAHYSDLTKPESSILAFFFAFYQLLFHLASLSLQAVYWAEAENTKADMTRRWRWRIESSLHATSVRLLTMWIPFSNLILLEIAASAFVDKTPGWSLLRLVALSLAAVLSLVATFALVRQAGSPSRPFLWAAIPLVGAALGTLALCGLAYLYNCIFHLGLPFFETLLLLTWLLTAGLVLAWIAMKFNPLRPGAFPLAIALYVVNLSLFLFYLLPDAARLPVVAQNPVATASLWAVQWIFGELLLFLVLCLLCAFIGWPLSAFCVYGIKKDKSRKARAIAAFRTGRFAFAVPAILFVIVTCTLWSTVVVYGSDKLKAFDGVPTSIAEAGPSTKFSFIVPQISPVQDWVKRNSPPYKRPDCECPARATSEQTLFWSNFLTGLLLVSVTPGLPIIMGVFILSLLLLAWAVLPSVIFELKPKCTKNAASIRIRSLGVWVSRGLDNIAILTRLLWLAIVPVPLLFLVLDWLILHCHLAPAKDTLIAASRLTLPLIRPAGLALAVSGATVVGLLLKYATTVLDTLLDVDNYLRTSPQDGAPRARIAERCTSLLRYIAAYRDDQNRPYSKVIIVAHSLGSMVTTDLLRYLERSAHASFDPDLARYEFRKKPAPAGQAKLPIYVFSMGCPLRQLLNRFFPHLYWWVSDAPDDSVAALGDPVGPGIPALRIPSLPRTDEMNVTLWSNAYRTGDYVGRSLWIGQWLNRNEADDTSQPPDVAVADAPQSCTEMCIGLGAHTHYWDRTAPEIAARLDELIG